MDEDREKLRKADKKDWYDRNIPIWWKNVKDLFDDPVWDGDLTLDSYCLKWFGRTEAEMRDFIGLESLEFPQLGPVKRKALQKMAENVQKVNELEAERKAMTPAERAKAYRARKKGKVK